MATHLLTQDPEMFKATILILFDSCNKPINLVGTEHILQ